MKNNLIVILCFTAGIFCGTFANTTISTYCEKLPQFLLYALCYPSRIESGSKRRIRKDGKGYPVFQFVTAVLYDHRHVSILCGGEFVIDLVEYI